MILINLSRNKNTESKQIHYYRMSVEEYHNTEVSLYY